MVNRITFSGQSRYPVSIKKIKEHLNSCLKELKVAGPVIISVIIVGNRKIRELNRKYRGRDYATNVLSFPSAENKENITFPVGDPEEMKFLGDLVVSYPQALKEAAEENKLVDIKILELLEHGLLHLLGYHHKED